MMLHCNGAEGRSKFALIGQPYHRFGSRGHKQDGAAKIRQILKSTWVDAAA